MKSNPFTGVTHNILPSLLLSLVGEGVILGFVYIPCFCFFHIYELFLCRVDISFLFYSCLLLLPSPNVLPSVVEDLLNSPFRISID